MFKFFEERVRKYHLEHDTEPKMMETYFTRNNILKVLFFSILLITGIIYAAKTLVGKIGHEKTTDWAMGLLILIIIILIAIEAALGNYGWLTVTIYPILVIIGVSLAIYSQWTPIIWPGIVAFTTRIIQKIKNKFEQTKNRAP